MSESILTGFIIVIDSSVTFIVVQFLVLAATLLGIDSYYTRIHEIVVRNGK